MTIRGSAIRCQLHGGPLDGTLLWITGGVDRLYVPVASGRDAVSWSATDTIDLASPTFDTFSYVISLEQYPIPAWGPTLIGYPEL